MFSGVLGKSIEYKIFLLANSIKDVFYDMKVCCEVKVNSLLGGVSKSNSSSNINILFDNLKCLQIWKCLANFIKL